MNASVFKRAGRVAAALLMSFILLLAACGAPEPDGDQIDFSDPSGEQGITTAAQFRRLLEEGNADTVSLNASIDLGEDMLRLDAEGTSLTIYGNGFTISGNGDCVIRLANGCKLTLKNITLNGGANAVGCLGDATLAGEATVKAVANALYAMGNVSIGEESRFYFSSNVGSGVKAGGLTLGKGARVFAQGALGGVAVTRSDLVLNENSVLDANTAKNYNALKCEGTLVMREGAKLIANNGGEYHGAEISALSIEGTVNIEARGGAKGVGLFLFSLEEDYAVVGFCEPAPRFEVGRGSLLFYASAAEIPTPAPDPEETPQGP